MEKEKLPSTHEIQESIQYLLETYSEKNNYTKNSSYVTSENLGVFFSKRFNSSVNDFRQILSAILRGHYVKKNYKSKVGYEFDNF